MSKISKVEIIEYQMRKCMENRKYGTGCLRKKNRNGFQVSENDDYDD